MRNKLFLFSLLGIVLLSISSFAQPYCTSTYTTPWQHYITNVNFNTVSNPTGPSIYSDFTSINTNLDIGVSYNLTTSIVNSGATPVYVVAWIDWNQDFDFNDPGESFSIGSVVGPTFGTNVTAGILVPAGANLGATRIRVSASRGFVPDPCNSAGYIYGETEDYSITVFSPPVYVTWDGESDTEWSNPLNWDGDVVPGVTDPVIIPGGVLQYPNFTGTLYVGALVSLGPNVCQSLIIENGASITIDWGGQINMFGNVNVNSGGSLNCKVLTVSSGGALYINGGTVTALNECVFWNSGLMSSGSLFTGKLEFKSSSNWKATGGTIYCLSGQDTEIISNSPVSTLNSLVVESGGTARLSGNSEQALFLTGDLVVEPNAEFTLEEPVSGSNISKITISEDLILEGNISGKASFIDENSSTILTYGTTAVESYYAEDRWHFISSPVTSAVSGIFLDLYLKAFDEPTNSYTPAPGITSTTHSLGVGQGFETFSDVGNGNVTISYVGGQLNSGDLSPNFTGTDTNGGGIGDGEGWNLIGNPYPSAIDVGTENDPVAGYIWTNIDSTIYAWNGTSWSSFNMAGNGTGVNGGTRYLPSLQGFFLKANTTVPSFSFSNSGRLHSSQSNYKSSINDDLQIKLTVNGNGFSDEMIVRAINSASYLFDSKYDAYKLPGIDEVPQLYTKAGTYSLSINTLPEFTEETIVPVCIEVGNSGIYNIKANDFDISEIGLNVYIEDIKEEFTFMLDANTVYEFSSSPIEDEHRFNLIFKNANNNEDINSSTINIFSFDNLVQIRKEIGISSDTYVYDIMGREVARDINNMENKIELQITNGTGYYVVKVITKNELETKKVFIK